MPLTNYGEPYCLQALFGGTTSQLPTPTTGAWYVGLIKTKTTYTTTGTWQPATRYAVGDVIVPTNFSSSGGTNHVYYVTSISGTGTSAATAGAEPTWPTGAGVTVTDNAGANQIVWTEATNWLYTSSNITALEVTGTNYARIGATNAQGTSGTGAFFMQPPSGASLTAPPAVTYYANDLTFTASGGNWGYVVGFFLSNVSTGGNAYAWNTLTNFVPVLVSGMIVKLPTDPTTPGLKITLT